jgi:hypothetical protein
MSRSIPINNIRMPFAVLAGRSVDIECSWVIILSQFRYENDITVIALLATALSVERAPAAGSALHSPQIRET